MTQQRRPPLPTRAFRLSALAGLVLPALAMPVASAEEDGPATQSNTAVIEQEEDGAEADGLSPGRSDKKKRRLGPGGPETGAASNGEASGLDSSLNDTPDVQSQLPGFPGLQGPLPVAPALPGGVSLLPGGVGVFPNSAPAPAPSLHEPQTGALNGPLGLNHPLGAQQGNSTGAHHEQGASSSASGGAQGGADHHSSSGSGAAGSHHAH